MKTNQDKETSRSIIHWFRNDLRLLDNPALAEAAKSTQPVVAVYVLEDSGISPENDYPLPIVDHMDARNHALDMFKQLRL